jgi:predicted Zn-dependent protease
LVQIGKQAYADRYMYPPILGLLIVFLTAFFEMHGRTSLSPFVRRFIAFTGFVWIVLGALTCFRQVSLWENTYVLASESEIRAGETAEYTSMKARTLYLAGMPHEALELARKAYSLAPNNSLMIQNLTALELAAGNFSEGERLGREHVRRLPRDLNARINYAIACQRQSKWDEVTKTMEVIEVLLRTQHASVEQASVISHLKEDVAAARARTATAKE